MPILGFNFKFTVCFKMSEILLKIEEHFLIWSSNRLNCIKSMIDQINLSFKRLFHLIDFFKHRSNVTCFVTAIHQCWVISSCLNLFNSMVKFPNCNLDFNKFLRINHWFFRIRSRVIRPVNSWRAYLLILNKLIQISNRIVFLDHLWCRFHFLQLLNFILQGLYVW